MIASRSLFFRVDRVLKLTHSCSTLKPVGYFQVKMAGTKDKQNEGELRKKHKPVNPVWRPVTTQASSYEDVKVDSEAECSSNVKYGASTSIASGQTVAEVTESVIEVTEAVISSSGLDDTGEGRVSEGLSVVCTEKHSLSVEVGASLMRFVKGKGGSTQKKIEEEMGVTIVFPSSRKEDSLIIEGVSVDSVAKASARIQAIIDQAVKSPSLEYSHFISLPLAIHPELVDKLVRFQNSILGCTDPSVEANVDSDSDEDNSENEDEGKKLDKGPNIAVKMKVDDEKEHVKVNITNVPLVSYAPKSSKSSTPYDLGIEKSIFIKPKTFHLTVLMLKLWNKERVDAANEVLQSISSQVMDALDNRPIFIRLQGLDCLRGSLAKARVVYAPVEEVGGEGRLLRACQVIIDAFVKAGLVLEKDANHSLKLHATVMNARHRKWTKGRRTADSFDARSIFKQYGSEDWGEYVIREAHLSQRFLYDDSGYYHCCTCIPFPKNMQVE